MVIEDCEFDKSTQEDHPEVLTTSLPGLRFQDMKVDENGKYDIVFDKTTELWHNRES